MIRTGDTLTNPVTGEQLHFVETAAETGGEYVLVEVTVEPNGFLAAAHVHPFQTEAFEILEGTVSFEVGRKRILASPVRPSASRPAPRTDSGTRGTGRPSSRPRSGPHCSSSP